MQFLAVSRTNSAVPRRGGAFPATFRKEKMPNGLTMPFTRVRFSMSMRALALLFCAFNISPSFAQGVGTADWPYHGNTLDNERFQNVDLINL